MSQSPYKGFNSGDTPRVEFLPEDRINPPIRGSIGSSEKKATFSKRLYQSPYKGFNRKFGTFLYRRTVMYQSPYKGFNSCRRWRGWNDFRSV